MARLPALSAKKIIAILKTHGFQLHHTTGSHLIFRHPENSKRVTVPYHTKDLPKGTLLSILKQAGLSKDDV